MPWKETCRMDERMRFVMSCEAGEEDFSALCRRWGVSRKTGYKWLERYRALGPVGLVDFARAPHTHPNETAEPLCERVIAVRRAHPRWGPKKIRAWRADREPEVVWPAASTIGHILKRAALVVPRQRRRRRHRRPGRCGCCSPHARREYGARLLPARAHRPAPTR